MAGDRPRGPGRPAHEPTAETRELVLRLVGENKTVTDIAVALGLSEPTVRGHYAEELTAERPQLNFPFSENGLRQVLRQPNRRGRPVHVPTAEARERVEVLVAGSMPQWQIAAALGISVPTLCEHYTPQLENGRARKKAAVLEALFKAGVEGGNVSALKAWLAQPEMLNDALPPVAAPKEAAMGKKQQAVAAAETAGVGTEWQHLLPN